MSLHFCAYSSSVRCWLRPALAALGIFVAAERAVPPVRGADFPAAARPAAKLAPEDEALVDEMERAAFRFFVEQSDPGTGLVRDRARADGSPSAGKASIAASGFGLASWAVATERGWVDRATAVARVRQSLRFLVEQAPRHRGFFYHFMEPGTGARAWKSELSPIDTGLFLAGAVIAREYFGDREITALVDHLYSSIDWRWFLNGGSTLALGWTDEAGFSRFRWNGYSEHMLLSLLGLGAPARELPADYWNAWRREPAGTYDGLHYIQGAPLFIHQFTHAFVDFRDLRDAYADYYRNSVLATRAQRQFCIDLQSEFPSWGERLWGVTASDSSTGYKAWGGPPRTTAFNRLDGTLVPCAAAGSMPFAPAEVLTTLRYMRSEFGNRIWQRYGFVDSFNPETGWVNQDVLAIDQGISLLQGENTRTGFVWSEFMRAPEVQAALNRAGFVSTSRVLTRADQDRMRTIAGRTWELLEPELSRKELAGLGLSAVVAARALGLVDNDAAAKRAARLLKAIEPPSSSPTLAEYAAGLVTLRQAMPGLASDATRLLNAIDWRLVVPNSGQLGALDRLVVFFQVATGARPVQAWLRLARTPAKEGSVFALSPARVPDELLPGLWLDEREIISGSAAAQLAYARLMVERAGESGDVLTTALLLEHFPTEAAERLRSTGPTDRWLAAAAPADRAALLLSLANLLAGDCLREWFQDDPLARAGRAAIPEFAEAAFGADASLLQQRELAGPPRVPPERRAAARPAATPRAGWQWTAMSGLDYKDSDADVRPGDPPLSLRFAFTWDRDKLYYHAEVQDTAPGSATPAGPRGVELLLNPQNNGLVWSGPDDFHFSFRPGGPMEEWFHHRPANARVRPVPGGYAVEAEIPWKTLGVEPHPGFELGISPAVVAEGTSETDPALKLTWRLQRLAPDHFALGVLRLE